MPKTEQKQRHPDPNESYAKAPQTRPAQKGAPSNAEANRAQGGFMARSDKGPVGTGRSTFAAVSVKPPGQSKSGTTVDRGEVKKKLEKSKINKKILKERVKGLKEAIPRVLSDENFELITNLSKSKEKTKAIIDIIDLCIRCEADDKQTAFNTAFNAIEKEKGSNEMRKFRNRLSEVLKAVEGTELKELVTGLSQMSSRALADDAKDWMSYDKSKAPNRVRIYAKGIVLGYADSLRGTFYLNFKKVKTDEGPAQFFRSTVDPMIGLLGFAFLVDPFFKARSRIRRDLKARDLIISTKKSAVERSEKIAVGLKGDTLDLIRSKNYTYIPKKGDSNARFEEGANLPPASAASDTTAQTGTLMAPAPADTAKAPTSSRVPRKRFIFDGKKSQADTSGSGK